MQAQPPQRTEAEQESRILLGIAGGMGCILLLCIITSVVAVLLALIWTTQGNLGPSLGWSMPDLVSTAATFSLAWAV